MKKTHLFLLFFVFLMHNIYAQPPHSIDKTKWLCTYNYEFLQDSSSINSLKNVQMYLQIGSHLSKFTCVNSYLMDSIRYLDSEKARDPNQPTLLGGSFGHIISDYRIYKNYPKNGQILFTTFSDNEFYKLEQQMQMNWKLDIQKDTVIMGYTCHKALTFYAGRDYIAWYSPQIPLSDGPYKFNGLPGLILKISDTKRQHCFTLNSIKKVTYDQSITQLTVSYVVIKAEDYIKIKRNELLSLYRMFQSNMVTVSPLSEEHKARILNGLKTTNNFIEKL